ncbi:hypothetical protein BDV93DRAFT_147567 [Ceratobasidium sp. AG-I]|nr:hypothetical protein BDV93DRAFT_147567 [Ceratobasidium sp. AG-I]
MMADYVHNTTPMVNSDCPNTHSTFDSSIPATSPVPLPHALVKRLISHREGFGKEIIMGLTMPRSGGISAVHQRLADAIASTFFACPTVLQLQQFDQRTNRRPIHTTRPCCGSRLGPGSEAHVFPQDTASRGERLREPFSQPKSRAPPPQPPIQNPTSRQLSEAWGNYQERCRAISLISRGTSPKKRQLTFSSIPWPVFGAVTQLSDLKLDAIRNFLCAPDCHDNDHRARVKNALLTFHPDKTSRWFSCLRPEDKAIVQEALNIVTHHLTIILHSL